MNRLRQVSVLVVAVGVMTAGLLVPALGAAEGTWSTPVDLSAPGLEAGRQQVDISGDGKTIASVWTQRYDDSDWIAQAKISTDRGSTWAKHTLSAPDQDAFIPQVAVSADGKTIATVWRRYDGSNKLVQSEISTDRGNTWATHTLSAPGQYTDSPQIAVSGDGRTIATVWHRRSGINDVQAKISTDHGTTWTEHNLSTPGQYSGEPQVGVSADGETIVATWLGPGVQAKISTDRGTTWTQHNLSAPDRPAIDPQVGVSADGKTIAIAWDQYDGSSWIVEAKTSGDSGTTWSTHPLSAPGQESFEPQVGVSADGKTIATVWYLDYGSNQIVQASVSPPPTPVAPSAASYTPLKRNRTRVRWTASSNATGYRVVINGKTKCTRSASKSRCTAEKAYGPRAKVRVIALGANADSPATKAKYRKSAKTIVFGTVHFRPKSARLTKKNKTIVRKKTKALARRGFKKTTVFGYTAKEANPKKLSKKRAEAVKKVMRKKLRTMDVSIRIKTVAKGNKNSIGNNNTKKGRAKNRRATINIR